MVPDARFAVPRKNNSMCDNCKKKNYIKDIPEFVNAVHDKNDLEKGYTSGSERKIEFNCEKCGSVYDMRIPDFNRGRRCSYCCGRKVNETNWAYSNKEMYDASIDKEILKTVTVGSEKKNTWLCDKCNKEYESMFFSFKSGRRCPRCCPATRMVDKDNWAYFNKDMFDASVDKEILKTVTVNSHKKNTWLCDKCNKEYVSTFLSFNYFHRCPRCCHNPRIVDKDNWAYSNKEMLNYVEDKETLKTVTECSAKKINWKCDKCDFIYKSTIANFKNGNRCPKCKESKGEKFISKYLVENNIGHMAQYRIKKCKNKRPLPFDFAIIKDDKFIGLIEFHGELHSQSVKHFGGDSALEYRQQNDQIKEDYCKSHNIPLLILWHHQDNQQQLLEEFLQSLNLL